MTTHTAGIDVSRWQGSMDYHRAAVAGARFVFARATVGDYYTDPQMVANVTNAQAAGLLAGVYHVLRPDISATAQLTRLSAALEQLPALDLPLVLDCEISAGMRAATITRTLWSLASGMTQLLPSTRKPIIYTRRSWWQQYVQDDPDWQQFDLFVAHYTNAPRPILPRDWSGWTFWQWSADGNGAGAAYGAESHSIDLVRFAGSESDLQKYAIKRHATRPPVPVTPPQPTWPQTLPQAMCLAPSLFKRRDATTRSLIVGRLRRGDVFDVIDRVQHDNGDIWLRIGHDQWCAQVYNGRPLVEFLS
jgi:lysozyme